MEPIIICFECHRRITLAELKSGKHDHADIREAAQELGLAATSGDQ